MRMLDIDRYRDWGPTLLRLAVGAVFVAHGAQKLFVFGHDGVTGFLTQLGLPAPALAAALLAAVEFLGGAALVLGAGTRVAAAALAVVMAGAFALVHAGAGFFLPDGYEFVLTLFAANVSLLLTGPGAVAVDNLIARPGEPRVAPTVVAREREEQAAA